MRNDYTRIFPSDWLYRPVEHLLSLFDVIHVEVCMLTV